MVRRAIVRESLCVCLCHWKDWVSVTVGRGEGARNRKGLEVLNSYHVEQPLRSTNRDQQVCASAVIQAMVGSCTACTPALPRALLSEVSLVDLPHAGNVRTLTGLLKEKSAGTNSLQCLKTPFWASSEALVVAEFPSSHASRSSSSSDRNKQHSPTITTEDVISRKHVDQLVSGGLDLLHRLQLGSLGLGPRFTIQYLCKSQGFPRLEDEMFCLYLL